MTHRYPLPGLLLALGLLLTPACTTPLAAPSPSPSAPLAAASPAVPLQSRLKLEPGRMFAYDVTQIGKDQTRRTGRTAYRIVKLFNDEDFSADYVVVTASGQRVGEEKLTFTRPNGIFYPAYTPYHPKAEAYTETETLTTTMGPVTAQRTSVSFLRPKAQTRDTYTYWIVDRMLVRQHLVSESDGEEITEITAVEDGPPPSP